MFTTWSLYLWNCTIAGLHTWNKYDTVIEPQWPRVKNLPAMQETQEAWARFLGQEDHLEKEMATTPVFLPGEFHGQRSLVGCCPLVTKESDTT